MSSSHANSHVGYKKFDPILNWDTSGCPVQSVASQKPDIVCLYTFLISPYLDETTIVIE